MASGGDRGLTRDRSAWCVRYCSRSSLSDGRFHEISQQRRYLNRLILFRVQEPGRRDCNIYSSLQCGASRSSVPTNCIAVNLLGRYQTIDLQAVCFGVCDRRILLFFSLLFAVWVCP